jgi:hypothetical protein
MDTAEKIIKAIDSNSLSVNTDSLDISFGEISSMYDDGELEIKPTYQRLFRWSLTQQSQLIESLLLGLPIPPIFVVETETRKYELIDGLQRISTYLHFMGILKNHPQYEGKKLKLINCDIVKELNGATVDDLSPSLRIKVKRSYVKMYIIKRESPPRIKYDMFKRLNTGGSLLSAQEIRNSTIRLLDEKFIDFIQKLARYPHFQNTISYVRDNDKQKQYADELVLRFFTIKNGNLKQYKDEDSDATLADYMTKFAEDVATQAIAFDYNAEEAIFNQTFEFLDEVLGKDIFALPHSKQFYAFQYEAFSIAVANLWSKKHYLSVEVCREAIKELKQNPDFLDYTYNDKHKAVSGKDYLKFLYKRLEFAERKLRQS